jgi:hypothetical protein
MSASCVIQEYWRLLEQRAWEPWSLLLAPDFVCEWPQSEERFDRQEFLLVNRHYPGDWHVTVRSIHDAGEWVISEAEVELDGRIDRAVSFFRLCEMKIVALREFWPEPFSVPEWRKNLVVAVRGGGEEGRVS